MPRSRGSRDREATAASRLSGAEIDVGPEHRVVSWIHAADGVPVFAAHEHPARRDVVPPALRGEGLDRGIRGWDELVEVAVGADRRPAGKPGDRARLVDDDRSGEGEPRIRVERGLECDEAVRLGLEVVLHEPQKRRIDGAASEREPARPTEVRACRDEVDPEVGDPGSGRIGAVHDDHDGDPILPLLRPHGRDGGREPIDVGAQGRDQGGDVRAIGGRDDHGAQNRGR